MGFVSNLTPLGWCNFFYGDAACVVADASADRPLWPLLFNAMIL
ncbi:hypothetical protein [Dehalobacter restrictus]|nr:hypothetical protein [Dehalobacter restrictus]